MLNDQMLIGEKVRLIEIDPERDSKTWANWRQNSEFLRLLDSGPSKLHSAKANQEWMEKHLSDYLEFEFAIATLESGQIIGSVGLDGNIRTHADAFVGIGIGDTDYWGMGYGTDAMRVILRYGFMELGLHRVSLNVFSYNTRAIKSYEKIGFRTEAVSRNYLMRDGQWWDMVWMGILREEWSRENGN